jgi:hypothetical protein
MIFEVKDELRGTLAWLRITLRPQCVTEVAKARPKSSPGAEFPANAPPFQWFAALNPWVCTHG